MSSSEKPRLYVVATSHLDTQWRWTIQTTIRHFLKRTLLDNFAHFRKFPEYVLSFEGSFRYRLLEEHYPEDFVEVQRLVESKRWRPAGSMVDAPDVNIPAPESLIRHILYGNDDFERMFGRRSRDLFLPDCFGFPWSLPTIAAHCGLAGFSSQKLIKWIKPETIPFDLGLWEGPDGSSVVAVLDPGGYGSPLREDLSSSKEWLERFERKRANGEPAIGYKYFGVGDRGGAPDATSLDWLRKSLSGDGEIEVLHTGSDQLFRDLTDEERERLPVHRGDLLLPTHGTGCLTSQSILKRWNRRCEVLATAAETAALAATWLGAEDVPHEEIGVEWRRFLWHQMHDDLTGTSSPEAYRFSWNDLVLAQNRLAGILEASVAAVAQGLDTRAQGVPLVVYNPTGFAREEIVDAWVELGSEPPTHLEVLSGDGERLRCQEIERSDRRVRILFAAPLRSTAFEVFEVREAPASPDSDGPVAEEEGESWRLENHAYRVEISTTGAVTGLYDKRLERELLAGPMDLALLPDESDRWPAWEVRFEDVSAPERALDGPAEIRVVENGPVRATIEILRKDDRSTFRQTLSLAARRAGERLEIDCDIDWQSPGTLLKASFPLAIDEPTATYDLGLGAVERGANHRGQYEVPGHEWADLSTAESGHRGWGVSVLSRDRYGWDRPSERTLRLSLLRSPKALRRFAHQAVQDYGRHQCSYAVHAHAGPRSAGTVAQAIAFNQPPFVFQAHEHPGALGRRFGLLDVDGDGVAMMALKRAEQSDCWLLRLREACGGDSGAVVVSAAAPLRQADEVDGSERDGRPLSLPDGRLTIDIPRNAPRSYLLTPDAPGTSLLPLCSTSVPLDFDTVATSLHGFRGTNFDGQHRSLPGELFPERVRAGGLTFALGPVAPETPNAMACRGQRLALPEGEFDTLHLLAASTEPTGTSAELGWSSGGQSVAPGSEIDVPYYSGFVGQWKRFGGRLGFIFKRWQPGYIRRTPVAWVASHLHDRRLTDLPYTFGYLFLLTLEAPSEADAVELPNAPAIKLFSAVVSNEARYRLRAAAELYG